MRETILQFGVEQIVIEYVRYAGSYKQARRRSVAEQKKKHSTRANMSYDDKAEARNTYLAARVAHNRVEHNRSRGTSMHTSGYTILPLLQH